MMVLTGCQPSSKTPQHPTALPVLQLVSTQQLPSFKDDLAFLSLREAIHSSLSFYEHLPQERKIAFGEHQVSVATLRESLTHFAKILESQPEKLEDSDFLGREFDVYRCAGGKSGNLLVTGYYEPVLQGSLQPTARYRYPLYQVPKDLVTIELSQFDPKRFGSERLVGRLDGDRVIPYYTRAEIDGQGKLERHHGWMILLRFIFCMYKARE
jgi:membrane-bound lytic murein transglycosylase A